MRIFLLEAARRFSHSRKTHISNWLPVHTLPQGIHYYHTSYSASDLSRSRAQISIPHAPRDRLLLSFAEEDAVRRAVPASMEIEPRYSMSLSEFLSGQPERGPKMKPYEARDLLTEILRQAFDATLRERGLIQFDNRWFVPRDWRANNKGWYLRSPEDETYRVLVGKSKELTWHLALSGYVFVDSPARIQVIPHVLFSPDGVTPLTDQKQLRRTRCKLWWNDKWRDLVSALLAELFGKNAELVAVGLGGSASMSIGARLTTLPLAASYAADDAFVPDAEEDVDWLRDEGDDGEATA